MKNYQTIQRLPGYISKLQKKELAKKPKFLQQTQPEHRESNLDIFAVYKHN